MKTSWMFSTILLCLSLLMVISGCNPAAAPAITTAASSPTAAPSATPTSTPLPPTPTSTTPPPTATATATSTATSTSTSTATPTSIPPSMTLEQNVTCYTGPGTVYDVRAYLSQGAVPVMLGRTTDESWWLVEEPEFSSICWVSTEYVNLEGDLHLLPLLTPEPTPTQASSPTAEQKGMKVFLVNLGTGGPFGCGDGLVYYFTGKQRSDSVERDIKSALNALFKLKTKYVGEFYNPVYNAHLYVEDVDVIPESGKVLVYLQGSIPKPPDTCEAARIHDQVWETARQISGFRNVTIRVGSKLLGDLIAVGDR